jgi:hypothetical protein
MAKVKATAKGESRSPLLDEETARWGACLIKQMSLLKKALKQGENDKAQEYMKAIGAITQEDVKEEPELRCVGMLHARQVQPWSCHMMECALSYHALRR